MATTASNPTSPEESSAVLRSDTEKTNGFTAVNGEAEISTPTRPALEQRGATAPPSRERAPKPVYISGDMTIPGAGLRLDRIPSTADDRNTGRHSHGTSPPPAKRKRVDDTVLTVRTTAAEASSSKAIKTSPESQAREIIHLVSPEQPPRPTIETGRYQDPHEPTSVSRSNDRNRPWNPQHVRSETIDELQRSLHASTRGESSQQQEAEEVIDSDAESLGPHINADGSRKPRRQFSHRTKTGCFTCRRRKKKCDEAKPICLNCVKGKFQCHGYGTKPVGDTHVEVRKIGPNGVPYPIQPSEYGNRGQPTIREQPWSGPYHNYPPEPSRSSYGPPHQQYPPPSRDPRDTWPPPSYPPEQGLFHQPGTKLPAVDFNVGIPDYPPNERRPPPRLHDPCTPPIHHTQSERYQSYGRDSTRMSIDTGTLPPMSTQTSDTSSYPEKDREDMLLGLPFKPWKSSTLLNDRRDCKEAVDRYNHGAMPGESLSSDERAERFTAVLDPSKRLRQTGTARYAGRIGSCGERTLVDAPFHCDYGYNLVIGAGTVISPNCYIQDPCEVIIGNRVIIGPNCRLYGMTSNIDYRGRDGSQGEFKGGTITINDGAWIGGDVVILPYRIIGEGAVVGAGSVVTRNVLPYNVVAGNPARVLRVLNEPESFAERSTRIEIQKENEYMLGEMRRRRYEGTGGYRRISNR